MVLDIPNEAPEAPAAIFFSQRRWAGDPLDFLGQTMPGGESEPVGTSW